MGWSGECESCMSQLLEDNIFRASWVSKREISQSLASSDTQLHPNRPPSLRRVEWELLELSFENWPGLLPNFSGQNTMYYI